MAEPSSEAVLRGLSQGQKTLILIGAFVIVAVSLLIAAAVMWFALQDTHLNGQDRVMITAISETGGTSLEKAILRVHAVESVIRMKLVANKQAIVLVAFAGAFALAAVGFALFLLGADGAFKLEQGSAANKLLFTGTAPGLLCFFLSASLIATGILHRSEITSGPVYFPGSSPAVQPSDRVCSTASGDDCIDNSRYSSIAPILDMGKQ